jgi:cytochrome c oxidase cbb3-type subunit 3
MRRICIVAAAGLLLCSGCTREQRDFFASAPPANSSNTTSQTPPGEAQRKYEQSAYHLSEGKRLFGWFNCVGCHANGGGGSGPALMDGNWRYGASLQAIVASIRDGRPNGMPAFGGRIADQQIWELAGYVRSLSGNVARDAAPSRNDDLHPHSAENRLETIPPEDTGPGT